MHSGCDLLYPLDVAFSAAVVPAFIKMEDVAQLWYNEKSNYETKKSLIENVKRGYEKGYEVCGFEVLLEVNQEILSLYWLILI